MREKIPKIICCFASSNFSRKVKYCHQEVSKNFQDQLINADRSINIKLLTQKLTLF